MLLRRTTAGVVLLVLSALATVVLAAPSYTTVASSTLVEDEVRDGDIVSYRVEDGTYHLSRVFGDEMVYGVVVTDPVLHLHEPNEAATGTPVVRYGEATINVSTYGGNIYAGDLVTTSKVPGVGQRVDRKDGAFVLGFALEDMLLTGDTVEVDGVSYQTGKVAVALRIGPYVTRQGAAFVASTSENGLASVIQEEKDAAEGFDVFKTVRYVLAAIVAIAAVLIAAQKFGDTFSQSIISVGRNPLAKSHIRAMMLWNVLVILIITGVGFGISAALILVP